jgi:hypothetical protein
VSPRPRDENLQADFWRQPHPPIEDLRAPSQRLSPASMDAAERIAEGPAFHGNRLTCLREIAKHHGAGGTSRKRIAEAHFAGMQNYVTGPVAVLIEEGLVYEDAARDRFGAIMQKNGKVVKRTIDHSAVLLLTQRGIAATRGAA